MTYKLKQLDTSDDAKAFNEQDVKGTSVLLDNVKVIAMGDDVADPSAASHAEGEEQPQQPAMPRASS